MDGLHSDFEDSTEEDNAIIDELCGISAENRAENTRGKPRDDAENRPIINNIINSNIINKDKNNNNSAENRAEIQRGKPRRNSEGDGCAAVWGEALALLSGRMTAAAFNSTLKGTTLRREGEAYVVETDNALAADWINNRMSKLVGQAMFDVTGQPCAVTAEVG
jgi:hypothetical protein